MGNSQIVREKQAAGLKYCAALRAHNRDVVWWADQSDFKYRSVLKILGWAVDNATRRTEPLSVAQIIRRGRKHWPSWRERPPHPTQIRRWLNRLERLGILTVEHSGQHAAGQAPVGNIYAVNFALKVVHEHAQPVIYPALSVGSGTSVSDNASDSVSDKRRLTRQNSDYAFDYARTRQVKEAEPASTREDSHTHSGLSEAPARQASGGVSDHPKSDWSITDLVPDTPLAQLAVSR